jgi:uncharacterized hydrophobic protein (TIGR00271 family)
MSDLPLQDQHREAVRQGIRQGAQLNWTYILMNALATVIACYGLFANSAAVVIGAMVVAMLLGPIAGVALGLVDSDSPLLRKSLLALTTGVGGVIIVALVIGAVHREVPLTNEIMARTAPNLFDLMIALAGGAAGAFAAVSPNIGLALVGVAIATALVPPLSSAGILTARGEYGLAGGAFLLALTNMVAIQLSFSTVLWLSGFHRFTRRAGLGVLEFLRRNAVSLVILIVLAIVLTLNFQGVVSKTLFEAAVRGTLRQEIQTFDGNYLAEVRFETTRDTTIVRAVVRGPSPPSAHQVAAMETRLSPPPDGTRLELRIRFVETAIITRNGILYSDAGFGEGE